MTTRRWYWVVLAAAVAAHVAGVLNGFANDDTAIIPLNAVVTQGHWGQALLGPYWQIARQGAGLYRPVTVGLFTLEWRLWGGSPLGFHVVNILLHGLAALLVLALLRRLLPPIPSVVGAVWFALQPVHVEAVANVVGCSELLAAAFFLTACLLYLDGARWEGWRRAVRLAGLCLLYLLALGSKEIAVTLPAVLILLEAARAEGRPLRERWGRQLPVYVSLVAMLAAYVVLRWAVLGTVLGEVPAPWFRGAGLGTRLLTALSLWIQYARLMAFPMALSSDYAPGVITISSAVGPMVVAGTVILVGWVAAAAWTWRRARAVSLGLTWFLLTVVPVSNLFFPTGMLVAERTLYLPSVGGALLMGGLVLMALRRVPAARARRLLPVAGLALSGLFLWRSETRAPTWASTGTVMSTLVREHPESYVSLRIEAGRLARAGDTARAAEAYEDAIGLAPGLYSLLVEAGGFYLGAQREDRAAELLKQAIAIRPGQPTAYVLLAGQRLRLGDGRDAHRVALTGLARSGPDAPLWALVSESYIAKGDLEAAVRARRAALGADPSSAHDWSRLADLLDALGRRKEAEAARRRSTALRQSAPSSR